MGAPFILPSPPPTPLRGWLERARDYLLRRWVGRVFLGALLVVVLGRAGLRLPGLYEISYLLFVACGLWLLFRLLAAVLRRFLWRIRTKLLFSYLFIALVPVVLLSLFFFIANVLLVNLVASHLVGAEVEALGQLLQAEARTALAGLPLGESGPTLGERLAFARARHPGLSYTLLRRGKPVVRVGDAPQSLPAWWKGPGFAGLVPAPGGERLRAAWKEGEQALILDVPVDAALFADLEKRTDIHLLSAGGTVTSKGSGRGIDIQLDDGSTLRIGEDRRPGFKFVALPERVDWETGERKLDALSFSFRPWELVRRLQPGALNMADLLVVALAAVGGVFLVMYAVALLLGLLLARSITRSIHDLSLGTRRLRQGDFAHTIAVTSRDQLGDLADSFNHMARGIVDLLREQAEKERLEEELRIARQIQMSLLPAQGVATVSGLRVAALCLPAAEVGGDYYDLLPLSDTRLGVLVADVSGKGTSAALYMAELKGLVLSLSRIYESPARLLTEANRILSASMDARSFITMTYAVVDTERRIMRYARAGHNPLLRFEARTGRTHVLAPPGLGLGIDRGERFEKVLEEAEVPLQSGDMFLFFTDGLSEAMNTHAELFGEGRLRRILEDSRDLPGEELKERILAEVRSFVGDAAQQDDMTLVLLKVA